MREREKKRNECIISSEFSSSGDMPIYRYVYNIRHLLRIDYFFCHQLWGLVFLLFSPPPSFLPLSPRSYLRRDLLSLFELSLLCLFCITFRGGGGGAVFLHSAPPTCSIILGARARGGCASVRVAPRSPSPPPSHTYIRGASFKTHFLKSAHAYDINTLLIFHIVRHKASCFLYIHSSATASPPPLCHRK